MTPKHNPSVDPELRTVSAAALLVDGSDAPFRQMLQAFMALVSSMGTIRTGFARITGITAPQHELILWIYRYNGGGGIGVTALAKLVNVTSAFVATETSKLRAMGLVEKVPCTSDRRRLTLRVTELGRERLRVLSRYQREVNDTLFECFGTKDFARFAELLEGVLPCSLRAADLVMRMSRDVAAGRGATPVRKSAVEGTGSGRARPAASTQKRMQSHGNGRSRLMSAG